MELTDLLQFGGKLNGVPTNPEGTPSPYASDAEWAAWRKKQKEMVASQDAPKVAASASATDARQLTKNTDVTSLLQPQNDKIAAQAQEHMDIQSLLTGERMTAANYSNNGDGIQQLLNSGNSQSLVYTAPSNPAADRVNNGIGPSVGVKATVDANGQVSLTNIDANTGTVLPRGMLGTAPNTPSTVAAILNQLGQTTDADTARGLGASFREALARETTAIQTQALSLSQKKLGVPGLEDQLRQAEAADRADPMWVPGIGDSSYTAKIRTALDVARNAADSEATRFLATNSSMAGLKAASKTAELELARVDKIDLRKQTIEDRSAASADLFKQNQQVRSDQKAEDKATQDAAITAAMTSTMRGRVIQMSGGDINASGDGIDFPAILKLHAKDKAYMEAVQAPDEKLPMLAVGGNQYAKNLVIAQEQQKTGQDPEIIKNKLEKIQQLSLSPSVVKDSLLAIAKGNPEATAAAQKEIANFHQKLLSENADEKEAARQQRIQAAINMVRIQSGQDFMNKVDTWKSIDPALNAAMDEAFKATGGKKLPDVLAAYTGSTTGAEYLAKVSTFNQLMIGAATKQKDSLFGMPDYRAATAMVANSARNSGAIASIMRQASSVAHNLDYSYILPPQLGIPALLGNTMRQQADVPTIDPATGKPFGAQ